MQLHRWWFATRTRGMDLLAKHRTEQNLMCNSITFMTLSISSTETSYSFIANTQSCSSLMTVKVAAVGETSIVNITLFYRTFYNLWMENSQPNGRQSGSYSAQYYFLPKFTPPHDYCDTCKELKSNEKASSWVRKCSIKWNTPNRNKIAKIETQKQVHKEDAFKAREFHHTMIEKCKSVWKKVAELEQKASLSEADTDHLEALKHQITVVISADYQQAKLLPHWGHTAQPGQTYYFQKISRHLQNCWSPHRSKFNLSVWWNYRF